MRHTRHSWAICCGGSLLLGGASLLCCPGCDRKETVLEVETPNTEVNVERDKETGAVDVEVDKD